MLKKSPENLKPDRKHLKILFERLKYQVLQKFKKNIVPHRKLP